jgi:hypothetical protein
MKQFLVRSLGAGLLLGCMQFPAHAVDGASLEFGTGNKSQFARGSLQWNFQRPLYQSENLRIGGYWDLDLAEWRSNQYRNIPGESQNLTEIGITPTFRLQSPGGRIFIDAGIGAHLLSSLYNNNGRRLSTAFEFGTKLSLGYSVTAATDVAVVVQHYSNGGIKQPNNGVNFASLKLIHRFQ